MIRVIDEFDLLPELFSLDKEFVKVDYWEKHTVDIQACHNDIMKESDILTVFINSEPDRQQAINGAWNTIRKMRPNNIFLVTEIDNQTWPFPTMFYPSWLKGTLSINKGFTHTIGKKDFLADALLGGMSLLEYNYRNNIVAELNKKELLKNCLVSLHSRDNTKEERPEYRSQALDKLDNPDFLSRAKQSGTFNTMLPNKGCGFGQLNYLSQVIPHRVYNATYVSLVAETETEYQGYCMSEKISKPLIAKKPFLIFAAPGYLQALHSIGFKTFSDWWSEEYDTIEDPDKRIQAIVESLESFNNLSTETKINYIKEMDTVTRHNKEMCESSNFIVDVINEIKKKLNEQ